MANFKLIKEIAREKGIPIRKIAGDAGLNEGSLHHLIKTGSTNTTTLEAIARSLGVSAGRFLDDNLSPSEETARIRELEKENTLLRELLAEKERTIQILNNSLKK